MLSSNSNYTDFEEYSNCSLCPRKCLVNRNAKEFGYCQQSNICRISNMLPHKGEEPCISGHKGSGTVFFSGCSVKCFFCQNYQLSFENNGSEIDSNSLYNSIQDLIVNKQLANEYNVHNLNLVTPDHFWPEIKKCLERLKINGVKLPTIFNCSGYENKELVKDYAKLTDIFLCDFKFADTSLAETCMNDSSYTSIAINAIREMLNLKGYLTLDSDNLANQGVLVRHLVLPNQVENSIEALNILKFEFGSSLDISLMSQFKPTKYCLEKKMFTTQVEKSEYNKVLQHATSLKFKNIHFQEPNSSLEFMPDFNSKNPFSGNS